MYIDLLIELLSRMMLRDVRTTFRKIIVTNINNGEYNCCYF